jgi:hypothetical protein
MYAFEDLDGVHSALNLLMRREPPLVRVLPRQAGTKEARYMHLLGGDAAPVVPASDDRIVGAPAGTAATANAERIAQLEEEVNVLRRELETLREQFASFQKQFQ